MSFPLISAGDQPAVALAARLITADWLLALPDVHGHLARAPAHVADMACGPGWSTLALARAYPRARFDGFDDDAALIEEARRHARGAGLDGRVRFYRQDVADPSLGGTYDVVTIFALDAMPRPVAALRTARGLLAEGGCVLVASTDPREHALAAGFGAASVLPIGHDRWRFHRLDP